jgi:undecaprenyl diphosphate synthase
MNHLPKTVPQHIAIIMDGNRRWAKEHNLPPIAGHQYAVNQVLEPLIEHAVTLGIRYLTFWAFSTENWSRDPVEVSGIMRVFRDGIKKFGLKMHKKGIRIKTIGDMSKFSPDIRKSMQDLTTLTQHNRRITAIFALNYGGRDEILRAFGKMQENSKFISGKFSEFLDTAGIPDPELIIRTGGEQRLSGFLLWQSEYSELYFPKWYMPDFTPEKLDEAVAEYAFRQRRFGK